MARLRKDSWITISGEYDHAKDPSGGAVGLVSLQVFYPQNCTFVAWWTRILVPLASGGGGMSTISFGVNNPAFMFVNPTYFTAAALFGTYNTAEPQNQSGGAMKFSGQALELVMSITVDPLVGGRIIFGAACCLNDF